MLCAEISQPPDVLSLQPVINAARQRRAIGENQLRGILQVTQRNRPASGTGFSHYVASKMGAIRLVCALANELAADNIIVNAEHPGRWHDMGNNVIVSGRAGL
ncbi:hypothetical protein [Caballeronia sp. DA-9]|uniref:hypothetical protein n=1 Tax=Caballeronia sp. DA-9 TaxID=3436237 RepID=UPI003F66276A